MKRIVFFLNQVVNVLLFAVEFQHGSLCETTHSVTAAVALLSACLCVHFSSVCPLSGGVSV